MATASLSTAQTWVYDPDSGEFPNGVGQPFASPGYQFGANSFRTIDDLGGGDKVLSINTSPNGGGNAIGWEMDAPNPNWNVTDANGYSVEWKVKLDPTTPTNPSSAGILAGNANNYGFMRVYNHAGIPGSGTPGKITMEIQSPGGSSSHVIGADPTAWHTYRMDVKSGVGKIYFDAYPFPIATQNLGSGGANAMWFGDGTGVDNGKYQVQYVKTWQSAPVATAAPDPAATTPTRFLAHYDGNSGNNGVDADFAVGSKIAVGNGGQASVPGKFGGKSLDGYNPSGEVTYQTAGNLNVDSGTIEMWVKTDQWADGQYRGLFSATQAVASSGDIRIQKTSGNALEVMMTGNGYSQGWSLNSGALSLDSGWHHLAWSWDFDANKAALYVDGTVVDNSISYWGLPTIGFPGLLNPTFEVGTIQNGSGAFNGFIDEFRISDQDLYGGMAFNPSGAPWLPEPATGLLMLLAAAAIARRR
jgi:hypothetical protein